MKMILLLVVSLFFRLVYLGVVPASLSHDETDNIIQAHALIQTGTDIEGKWELLSFLPNSGVMGELSPAINAPALSLLPNNLFTARLTTALLSSIFPLLVMIWLLRLNVEKFIASVTAWLIIISPWHILFSRTALEQPTSLFFYLLSWIFLAQFMTSKDKIKIQVLNLLLFIAFYSLGYFTYHGYKFALPLLTSILIIWHYISSHPRLSWKKATLPLIVIFLLIIRTVFYSNYYDSRSSELIVYNTSRYESLVNTDRRQSLAPEGVKNFFSNKPVKLLQNLRDKYVNALDPKMLFLRGEANGVFSTWQTGYLYLLTLPFLIIGLGYLIINHSKHHILFLSLLIFSPVATVMHVNDTIAFRSGIYFVLLNIVVAYGLYVIFQKVARLSKLARLWILAISLISLAWSISFFLYIYFFVTPVTNANSFFFSDRLVANYIRLSEDKKILLIVSQPRYLYSAIQLTKSNVSEIDIESFNKAYSPTNLDEYFAPDLVVARSCPKADPRNYDVVIVSKILLSDLGACEGIEKLLAKGDGIKSASFVSPQDSGEEYRIFNDQLCNDLELSSYVHPTSLADFQLEDMSKNTFCNKWVVRQ